MCVTVHAIGERQLYDDMHARIIFLPWDDKLLENSLNSLCRRLIVDFLPYREIQLGKLVCQLSRKNLSAQRDRDYSKLELPPLFSVLKIFPKLGI